MDINSTLLVQAINFFIAYCILRWLLFKPAVAVLQAEQSETEQLLAGIDVIRSEVALKRDEQEQSWKIFQQSIATEAPATTNLDRYFFTDIVTPIERHPLTPEQEALLVAASTQEIIRKVNHVRQ